MAAGLRRIYYSCSGGRTGLPLVNWALCKSAVFKAIISIYIINFRLMFPAILTPVYHVPNVDDALACFAP